VGYVRVSTDEQADSGLGLASQRDAIEAECVRRQWRLIAIYEDAGISGKKLDRPGLMAALDDVGQGRAAAVVVAKLDRLSRSLVDFAGLMARARDQGWNLVALDLGIDLSTPAGEFMSNVMASAAQWERRIIGQRTRDALAVKRQQGVRLGRPTVLAPEVAERICAAHAGGASLASIARDLNARGVPTAHGGVRWYASTVRAVTSSLGR
jgi:DNA invertase Pin-like site-specific DNA recombinase